MGAGEEAGEDPAGGARQSGAWAIYRQGPVGEVQRATANRAVRLGCAEVRHQSWARRSCSRANMLQPLGGVRDCDAIWPAADFMRVCCS